MTIEHLESFPRLHHAIEKFLHAKASPMGLFYITLRSESGEGEIEISSAQTGNLIRGLDYNPSAPASKLTSLPCAKIKIMFYAELSPKDG